MPKESVESFGKFVELPVVSVGFGHLLGGRRREKRGWGNRQGLQ